MITIKKFFSKDHPILKDVIEKDKDLIQKIVSGVISYLCFSNNENYKDPDIRIKKEEDKYELSIKMTSDTIFSKSFFKEIENLFYDRNYDFQIDYTLNSILFLNITFDIIQNEDNSKKKRQREK